MESEFITYELALRMKQLGFDEPCLTCYDKLGMIASHGKNVFDYKNYNTSGYMASRPTWQSAFAWFREKGYRYTISTDCFEVKDAYYFDVWKHQKFYFESGFEYESYEEAQQACLEKLCEIIEKQKE